MGSKYMETVTNIAADYFIASIFTFFSIVLASRHFIYSLIVRVLTASLLIVGEHMALFALMRKS